MTTNGTTRLRRSLTLAATLALFATFSFTPLTKAATSGDVAVTAAIAPTITVTLCDQTAEFGSGLDAYGDPATGTTDPITAIPQTPGSPDGAFYRWDPNCAPNTHFFSVTSNVPWQSTICATVGANTSSLTLSDLKYTTNTLNQSYSQIATTGMAFTDCGSPQTWTTGSSGTTDRDAVYYLQVAPGVGAGSFSATTTVAVAAS